MTTDVEIFEKYYDEVCKLEYALAKAKRELDNGKQKLTKFVGANYKRNFYVNSTDTFYSDIGEGLSEGDELVIPPYGLMRIINVKYTSLHIQGYEVDVIL